MTPPLLYPIFAMVVLTFLVAILMFYTRVTAIKKGQVKISYFKTHTGEAPEIVIKASRHFSNLFELPVLYYTTLLAIIVVDLASPTILFFAWLFVVARYLHAFIHIFVSNIYPRMISYMVGWLALLGLWVCILSAA